VDIYFVEWEELWTGMKSALNNPLAIAASEADTPSHEPDIASYFFCCSGCLTFKFKNPVWGTMLDSVVGYGGASLVVAGTLDAPNALT